MKDLRAYYKNVYSQNGEDGIIQEIFKRLDIENGFVVEFGAADALWLSNTALWWRDNGFDALLMEANPESYAKLKENTKDFHFVDIYNVAVSAEKGSKYSLNVIFDLFEVPEEFELLSIDVDSDDYAIWQSLERYKPKVVIIEGNSSFGATQLHVSNDPNVGCSAASIVELARTKGYSLVAHCGNCIFVRDDLFHKIGITDNSLTTLWGW